MPRTVYIVTHGEYSSYGFDDAYEVRADADAWAKKMGGEVQDLTLYGPGETAPALLLYTGRQRKEDLAVRLSEQWVAVGEFPEVSPGHVIRWPEGVWEVHVTGTDRDRVMKVARDKVAQCRAEDAGL